MSSPVTEPPSSPSDQILILDFGSQYTQLIARRVRERGVYCEIHPPTMRIEEVKSWSPSGVILSGGPASVFEVDAPLPDPDLLSLGIPILGICYGFQWLAQQLGGVVESTESREYLSLIHI